MLAVRSMKLLSVNVGFRANRMEGKIVRTSIFKRPSSGRARVSDAEREGDQQSDLTVHGSTRPFSLSIGALPVLARAVSCMDSRGVSARTSQRRLAGGHPHW